MIQDKLILAEEKAYLSQVLGEISSQIDIGTGAAENYKRDAIALQKSMWEDLRCAPTSLFDLEDAAQINQIQMDLKNKASIYKFSYEKVDRLKRMLPSPYFGRIDFFENGERNSEKIYIGMFNLIANTSMDILIYDWRAPISGMFYDYEIGPASYDCPAGTIEGELLLKRQYKIENSNLIYMFDSSLNINDAMLQEILGKSTDTRMKTIVTSIQKEQNTVIRNSQDRILIVEGPAGSGKTSIALHRAAYLLYKYRNTVKSENILIFSPNHVFEDYISHVLPELGEENIRRSTFADFFKNVLPDDLKAETINQQMEYIFNHSENKRIAAIKFKSSMLFLKMLKRYVRFVEQGLGLQLKDLTIGNELIISAEEILSLFQSQSSRLPYANRLEKLREKLLNLLEQGNAIKIKNSSEETTIRPNASQETKEQYMQLKNEILQMTLFDSVSLYLNFMRNINMFAEPGNESEDYRDYAEAAIREQGFINYEDLAPIIYLKAVLEGEYATALIKHIILDEAQDYTPVQYEILKTVFKNSSMTILGDINQTVNGYMNIGSFDEASEIFNLTGLRRLALTKSYRSSKEIADFCKALLVSSKDTEQLNRHGAKPKVIKTSKNELYQRMIADIIELKKKGYKLIAVICKTAAQCKAAHEAIGLTMDIGLISNHNEVYYGDVVVIPSYLAKGLEFDAVLACTIEDAEYGMPEDRRVLYTVCTRALHELYMYFYSEISRFVSSIDQGFYMYDDNAN